MAGLRIAKLSKIFDTGHARVAALTDLQLEVSDGELLVILGPSGCGKTTLLRSIAGLERPDAGEIFLGAENITHRKPQDRRIGMAFQFPALLPQLTVGENISLGPKLRGVQAAESANRTRELADLLGVTGLLKRLPETLSGGQQQRVSLARALAVRPDLLLLDEPLANLDPTSRTELRETIRHVQQKLRITTLYVTHDQAEAAAIGDRIAIVENGLLRQIGTARELYATPANLFVAQFFAPERPNILTGSITTHGFQPAKANPFFPITSQYRGPATCVIRPRSFRSGGLLAADILQVQDTGWSTHLTLNYSGVTLLAELPSTEDYRQGETFHFSLPALLFFDHSGNRIES